MVRLAQALLFLILMSFAASTFAAPKLTPMVRKAALYSMLAKELNQSKISPAAIDWFYRKAKNDYDRQKIRKALKDWRRPQAVKFYGGFDGLNVFERGLPLYKIDVKQSKNKNYLYINNKKIARLKAGQSIFKTLKKRLAKYKPQKRKSASLYTLFSNIAYAEETSWVNSLRGEVSFNDDHELNKIELMSALVISSYTDYTVADNWHEIKLPKTMVEQIKLIESETGFGLGSGSNKENIFGDTLKCERASSGRPAQLSGQFRRSDGKLIPFYSSGVDIIFSGTTNGSRSESKFSVNVKGLPQRFFNNLQSSCNDTRNLEQLLPIKYNSTELSGGADGENPLMLRHVSDSIVNLVVHCDNTLTRIRKGIDCKALENKSSKLVECIQESSKKSSEHLEACYYEKTNRKSIVGEVAAEAFKVCGDNDYRVKRTPPLVSVLNLDAIDYEQKETQKPSVTRFSLEQMLNSRLAKKGYGDIEAKAQAAIIKDAILGNDPLKDYYKIVAPEGQELIPMSKYMQVSDEIESYKAETQVTRALQEENKKYAFAIASYQKCCSDRACAQQMFPGETMATQGINAPNSSNESAR